MLSFGMLFLAIVGAGLVSRFPAESTGALSWLGPAVSYVDTFKHLDEFTGALLDTRPFFFYLSTAAVFVAFTSLITESKNA